MKSTFSFLAKVAILSSSLSFSWLANAQVDTTGVPAESVKDTVVSPWKRGGVVSLTGSQVTLQNWAAGGQNAVSATGLVNLFANYKKGSTTWDNTLDLGYGLLQQGKARFRKSDDKIDLSSKYGHLAINKWYYSALLSFKTQFAPGFNLPNDSVVISDFLAPAYVLAAVGMDYKPNDKFTVLVAPLTAKTTIVNSTRLADAGAFGVEKATYDANGMLLTSGKKIRYEIGGYVKMMYRTEIMENITLQSKLDLFSNYANNPGNIDINWENLISFKVNKYINVSFISHMIYDDDVIIQVDNNQDGVLDVNGPRLQYKQVLGVGFSYKF